MDPEPKPTPTSDPEPDPTPPTNIELEPKPAEDPVSVESSTLEPVPAAMSILEDVLVELDILELIPIHHPSPEVELFSPVQVNVMDSLVLTSSLALPPPLVSSSIQVSCISSGPAQLQVSFVANDFT